MANKANSFLSGVTGGMGAMTNMIGARDQRNYNNQKMEWMKEDRALQDQKQKDEKDLRNTMASYELYRDMNKEQKSEFQGDVIGLFNKDKQVQAAINRNVKDGEYKEISGMYSAPNGIGFNINVRDANGKVIRNGPLTQEGLSDGSDKNMVVPMRDFLAKLGTNPGMVDELRLKGANILVRGGKLSEKKETFNQEERDGMLFNRSSTTNKLEKEADFRAKGRGGSGSAGGSDGKWKKVREVEVPDPNNPSGVILRNVERMGDSDFYRYADDDGSGNFQHNYFQAKNPQSLDSVFANPPPTDPPPEEVKKPPEEKPSKSKKTSPKAEPTKTTESTPASNRKQGVAGYYQLTDDQKKRASDARAEFSKNLGMVREEQQQKDEEKRQKRADALSQFRPGGLQ